VTDPDYIGSDFGPLVAAPDVDAAVTAGITEWVDTWFGIMERARGWETGSFARPKRVVTYLDRDEIMDGPVPQVVVQTSQTDGVPQYMGIDGGYRCVWKVAVSAVVRGPVPAATRQRAGYMEAALRQLMLNSLPDSSAIVDDVRWAGSQPAAPLNLRTENSARYLCAGIGNYLVTTDEAVMVGVSPAVPTVPNVIYVPYGQVTGYAIDSTFDTPPEDLQENS
jgi:hypothetical protein